MTNLKLAIIAAVIALLNIGIAFTGAYDKPILLIPDVIIAFGSGAIAGYFGMDYWMNGLREL